MIYTYHNTLSFVDVPAIISGKWLCFMDPQKIMWKGDPGRKYKLTNNTQQNSDSFSPFKFTDDCSLGTQQQYNGTLIRFPLRNEPSGLSNKLYTVAKLKELLKALKDDAAILLLFLRYVERIEVFTINTSSIVSKIFSVETDRATENQRRQLKTAFLSEVEKYHSDSNSQLPRLQYEVRITVHDVQLGTQFEYQWMIMHWVGSRDRDVLDVSNKVSSLPWIGLAAPLSSHLQCPSRLFCFLPLPDSKEVNPPLPVCVHGTFGLNKDRRHLKWIASDMKNDDGALWNEQNLLSKMLPSCYGECLNLLKGKCKPEAFYSFWPHASVINNTNWKIILNPLLPVLLQGQYFWSENGRWVGLDSSVCVVPQVNSSQFPKVVIDVLIRCGKSVVVLPDNVWDAVKFIYGSSYPFTTITPSVVRQAIRSSPQTYANLSRTEKFHLLHYCLNDRNYYDLNGLILLPTVVSTFVAFSTNQSGVKMHVCDKTFLDTKLLANNSSTLVNVEGDDVSLHHKLREVANNRCTQLQILTPESVAVLLKQTSPFQNGWCCYGSAGGFYNEIWLKKFWNWVSVHRLSYFVNIPLVPVCGGKNSNGFKVVALSHRDYTHTFVYNRSASVFYSELVTGTEKLGCHLTCSDDFPFLYHSELNNYVPQLSQSALLSIAAQINYQNVVFSQEEAKALKYFLFQHPVSVSLSAGNKSVATNLSIFAVLQTNNLTSLQKAKSYIGGNNAAMLVTESDIISKYTFCLLPSPLIITCERDIVTNLQARLPGTCWVPTKLQLIVHVILLAIENKQLSRDHILKVTSTLLDPTEYYSLTNTSGGQALVNKLRSLKYLPTSQNSDLFSPCEVYDPMDHVVKELFEGQNVFPIAPFLSVHFTVLKQLGMKDCNTLSPSDIIRVTDIIFNQTDTQAKVKRANNLLGFLSSPTGNRLLNEYYNSRPLDQTLRSLQWLPVITTPPKGYPKCLNWKGSSGSQFVSAQSLHASSSPDEHKKLPNLIGSQMKILQYEGTLSVKLIASLNIPQTVPVDAMILQLLDLITHKAETEIAKFRSILSHLYAYLQRAAQSNVSSKLWQQLSQSEVVQVSDNKFVLPSVVACCFDEKCMTVGKLEPYWYILPSDLQQYRSLFCSIGAKDKVTISDVLLILETMSSSSNHNISFQQQFEVVNKVLKWLCNFTENEIEKVYDKMFVPISTSDKNKLVLKPAKQVAFLDSDLNWVGDDGDDLGDVLEDYFLVHPSISYDMCCKLQLKPLNTMVANSEEFCFEQAGQSEPLTTRLNRILREYKDTSVIQELLQNADDAGATEVAIYYDIREHDSSHLFFPGMANSYGPALLFYNNAQFSEEDFENIRKIAGETKVNKLLKIGKFGVGFCSVYHITDVPSFVSGEHLLVFDPTLQCLHKEIKSELNPGIKINFNKHRLLKKSNQLAPYVGACGFNPKAPFQGTLFRFPLRLKGSKVSGNVYTESMLLNMMEQVKKNSSKLLMFLNNVEKISFYQSHGSNFTKDFEITTTKHKIPNNNDVVMCKVQVTTVSPSNDNKEENWLIASKAQQLQNHGTASVSVKLELNSSSNQFCVAAVKGECFCFLPLNIDTGLPVHVSSNFAVMTNRRGIWKADNVSTATKESNWNKALMESVVVQSYLMLLLHLQQMQQNGSLVAYTFHSLWPVILREVNPWEFFVDKFYVDIFTSQHPLFFSEIATRWQKFNECKFLSNKILAIGFDNELQSSVYHVATVLKLPVVNLPNALWDKLEKYTDFKSQILDEKKFIKYFYNDETLAQISVQEKTKIVAASLIVYANNRHSKAMPDLMKNTKCIPCSPDGNNFKYPHEILNPASNATKLFSPEDGMFPDEALLKSNALIITALSNLDLMKSLSWELIIDRAKCVQTWYNQNSKEALNRLVILMDCIKDNSSTEMPDGHTEQELQKIAFLPVMKKPNNYPISWKGDAVASLLSGPELIKVSQYIDSVNAMYACGSQVAILDTQFLPQQSRNLANRMLKVLGIKQEIEIAHVVNHFKELLEWFQPSQEIATDLLIVTNNVATTVYHYLTRKLNTNSNDEMLLNGISSLTDKHCIWNGKKFIFPAYVSFNWNTDGPYLFRLPDSLKQFTPLMKQLEVKNMFPTNVILTALSKMKNDYDNTALPDNCQVVVRLALPCLSDCVLPKDADIFLPDVNFILRDVRELKYNDASWFKFVTDEEHVYCHGCVERNIAIHLGVEPVRSILLDDLDITSDEIEFGQVEELTQRLNNILRDYSRDMTFLKELLQNADDAGAKKLYFILDKRNHKNVKVISEEWKALQGPALLFWNDSPFSDEDLVGIQKIGLGNKRDDPDKIGQYGIGFNVVYHFTDCPSFITNDKLCIMDPHYRYIARKRMKPGRMYKGLEKLWKRFPHMESPYLRNDLDGFPVDMQGGSLFRLPLRLKQEDAKLSKIVMDDGYFNLKKLENDLADWVPKMREALLFVHHVCDIRLYVIEDKKSVGVFQWDDPHPVVLRCHIESNKGREKEIMQDGSAKLVVYNMRLANKQTDPPQEEKWLIQLGEGRADDSSFDWKGIKPPDVEIRSQHGIAALLDNKYFYGKSFCYLPLPGGTKLPVHVHGQFVLHSDRRGLWISSNDDATIGTDKKYVWNKHLIEAISVSYANLLTHIITHDGPPCDREVSLQSLEQYYRLFPSITETTAEPWKSLAIGVYKQLSILNPPILATLVESDFSEDENNLQEGEDNQLYVIKWYNLHLPQQSNEGHFHSFHLYRSNICIALKAIGMNLVDTPREIYHCFKKVGVDLPDISKELVLAYYIRFQAEIINHGNLPCHVSESRFGNVNHFVPFIKYLSIHTIDNNSTEHNRAMDTAVEVVTATTDTSIAVQEAIEVVAEDNDDFDPMLNCGLIMTVDENIHKLCDGKMIINSPNWKLFPESGSVMLHNELLEEYNDSQYVFKPRESSEGWDLIKSVFSANLPSSWSGVPQAPMGDVDTSWVKKLLKCISEDLSFKPYCNQILQCFTLIPADNGVMYSSESEILPMEILPTENRSYAYYYDATNTDLQDLLRKLHVSIVDCGIIGSSLTSTNITLPYIGNPWDVLKNVYLASKDNYDTLLEMSKEELTKLFEIFALITFSFGDQSVNHIKSLPIFTTIYGKVIELSSVSTVWIWNDQVCRVGVEEWINHIPESVAFLDPYAPWKAIVGQAEQLSIKIISLYQVYCNYIFCHFGTMNSAMRLEHIGFIAENIYYSCMHESSYIKSPNHYEANMFINQFKSLECIGDDNSSLRTISSYYDHTQDIFKFFCAEHSFLPEELQGDDIQNCLRFFGLKTVPTANEFLNYCRKVQTFRQVSDVKKASKLLLGYLLEKDSSDCGHILRDSFLYQVSNIPIGIVKFVPKLNAIKLQQLGECTIRDDRKTVNVANLRGSCPVKFKDSVWTCKSVVSLPVSSPYDQTTAARMKALGISVKPTISDVIENLRNISNTGFADASRLHTETSSEIANSSCDLPGVIVNSLKCIATNLEEAQSYDSTCQWLKPQLENLKFLPVKLPVKGYVLVAPCQVLLTTPTQLTPYYPFLHLLIGDLQPHFQLLSKIGVKMSFDFCHMQLVLKLAKEFCKGNKVDLNTKRAVVQATVDLTLLLRSKNEDQTIHLQPLYLLNEEDILTECSNLVVFDTSGAPLTLPVGLSYLNPLHSLPVTKYWSPEELLHLLPTEFGLNSLRSILQHQMINATPVLTAYTCVTTIEQILRCNNFRVAIESYACHCKHTRDPPEEVTMIIANFQDNLHVQYLDEIQVKPLLSVNSQVILLQDTICQDFFLHFSNRKYILTLRNSPRAYPSRVFVKLARSLCLTLKFKGTKCFEVAEDDEVPELSSFICEILSCGSVFKVAEIIQDSLPGIHTIEQDLVTPNPELGEIVPDCWHHRLDQSMFNFYLPEDWVGYDTGNGNIVYAQVLHCIDHEAVNGEGDIGQLLQRKYLITIGGEPIEATVLQLYKFVSELKESVPEISETDELELYDTSISTSTRHARQAGGRKAIRDAVNAAWSLPDEQKRKALKRLYLQYHPDKNPDNPNATAEFQYLLQEMERMEKGNPEDSLDTEHPYREPGSFNFGWNGWFNQWNRTASSHKKYKSKDRSKGASGGGTAGEWHTPKPQTNHEEAIRWIKQAEYDYAALKVLMTSCQIDDLGAATLASSQPDEKTCASTCFMCHEVAEKSLKAGMYAKCGIGESTLKNHNVVSPARALIQMGCEIDVNDAIFLENFYYHPRFPSCHPPPTVPGEKYVINTATQAFDAATRIYETMKKVVEDDDD